MKITFVLPSDNRSGGVRVTVSMANELLGYGHFVRIAVPNPARFTRNWAKVVIGTLFRRHNPNAGWLHEFRGVVDRFSELDALHFAPGEIVIAVGSLTMERVYNLRRDVIKLRYNHGLLLNMSAREKESWRLPLPTITVASTIIPDLESLTGQRVRAVIPNGISLKDYHLLPEPITRSGVGTIYGEHPAKAPADTVAILAGLHASEITVPQYVFGTSAAPAGLEHAHYRRLPSVAEARELYNRCKVWFVASHTEGFPGPVLEAMACGCAVVSTDTYGGKEIIRDGENGLLVPRGDVKQMIASIHRVLADERLRERLAAAGLRTARGYSWENAAEKMNAFLAEFMEEQRKQLAGR